MSEHEGNTTPAETQEKVSEKIKNKVLESLDIQYINVNDIHPNEWNPNRQSEHDFELLLKSMREDGFTQPVVAIKTDEGLIKIVDGEHRWRAAHTLGFEDIPVVITPMTEEQAKIATLRHNRARGSEDVDLTAELLRDLEKLGALDWAQDSLMMDDTEIQKMLEDIPAPEALAADEYTEAWEPGEMSGAQEDAGTSTREIQGASGVTVAAASIASIERQRERERQIAEAKTAEERQALKKDNDIFRLYLTFTGDEATLVKQILGEQAAEKLIEMCKREEAELAEEDA